MWNMAVAVAAAASKTPGMVMSGADVKRRRPEEMAEGNWLLKKGVEVGLRMKICTVWCRARRCWRVTAPTLPVAPVRIMASWAIVVG